MRVGYADARQAMWDARVVLLRLPPLVGMAGVARALSESGGQVWLSGSGSCCWVVGSQRVWVLREELEGVTLGARRVLEGLGVEPAATVGGCARRLLEWVGEVRGRGGDGRWLGADWGWHYFRVEPGTYSQASLFDIDSAYYQLLLRVPSPAVHLWSDGSVCFGGVSRRALSRWWQVLEAVRPHKLLRNALVGASVGREDGACVFVRGEAKRVHVPPSSFAPLGRLVVGTTYQLCGVAAHEVGAVYANTDCVISPQHREPSAWSELGVRFSERARGDAEVCGVGVYRVGEEATVWYRLGHRPLSRVQMPPPDGRLLGWLREARIL